MVVASIIGAGRMGGWFATFLKENGYRVIVSDSNKTIAKSLAHQKRFRLVEDQGAAVQSADLVVLTTPTHVTRKILSNLEPRAVRGKVIVEMSSVKAPVRKTIMELKRKGVAILSIHPMFGPGTKSLRGKTILLTSVPSRRPVATKFLSAFRRHGARLLNISFDQHDKLVSMLLTLPHFANLALVSTMRALGANPNQLRAIGGTSFSLQFLTAEAVFQEASRNELSIFMDSKYSLYAVRKFAQQTSAGLKIIGRERRGEILRLMLSGRRFLERDRAFSSAYRRFNAAVEASSLV